MRSAYCICKTSFMFWQNARITDQETFVTSEPIAGYSYCALVSQAVAATMEDEAAALFDAGVMNRHRRYIGR